VKVLITGGAGFLGRGILKQSQDRSWEVTVYSRDETKQDEARRRYPFARYILGDVRDTERLASAMTGHDYVIHAAAMKYIPDAELNATECIAVNVDGSRSVMRAAKQAQVKRVVATSTDKAVCPVNVYGASKMLMERLFADEAVLAPTSAGTSFACVRYGNVIGSTGSVLPLFAQQAEQLGKVRITDLRMTRFWMSVDEAIKTIVFALDPATRPGSIVVPHARAMTLVDAARAATRADIEVEEIGSRPGEKIHESLIHWEESIRVLRHSDRFELLPVGGEVGGEAFSVVSHTPQHRMSVEQMRQHIAEAKEI